MLCAVSGPSCLTMMGGLIYYYSRIDLVFIALHAFLDRLFCPAFVVCVCVCVYALSKKASGCQIVRERVLSLNGFCLRELFDVKTCVMLI